MFLEDMSRNKFYSRFKYHMFSGLLPLVTYLLTLPRISEHLFRASKERCFKFICSHMHRMIKKSVNLKHSVVLMGMFGFKHAIQFIESYGISLSCSLNIEDLTSKKLYKISK
jgi:hypothetical protein